MTIRSFKAISGYGYFDGSGSGTGSGYGYDSGSGYGSGFGYGYCSGSGTGSGYGYGDNFDFGSGNGSGTVNKSRRIRKSAINYGIKSDE